MWKYQKHDNAKYPQYIARGKSPSLHSGEWLVNAENYVNRAGVLQLEPLVGLSMANGPQCVPEITGEWKQVENKTMIYHSKGKEYSAILKDTAILPCRYGGWIQVVEVYEGDAGSGELVLFTNDSVKIRDVAGGNVIVSILKNEILTTDSLNKTVQAADSNGNTLEWIKVRYFNNQDENNPGTWTWIEGWVAKKFTYEISKNIPSKSELHCSNDYLRQAQMLTNARYICDKLLTAGWTRNAIYGVLGNMETESNINPQFWQKEASDPGFGLVQWTSATKLTNWAASEGLNPNDIDTQLGRIAHELDNNIQWQSNKHSSGMSFKDFSKSTESPEQLAEIFLYCYEQPGIKPQPARSKQAEKWHDVLELLK